MSRIFVTGGSGRLGRSVVAGLAEAGHHVISVDRDAVPADAAAGWRRAGNRRSAGARGGRAPDPGRQRPTPSSTWPRSPYRSARLRTSSSPRTRGSPLPSSARRRTLGVPKIVTASSPTVLGYGSPAGWLPPSFPLDERTPPEAVERLRPVQAHRRADGPDVRRRPGGQDPLCGIPSLLRDFPRGVGRRAHPAGPHPRRAACRSRAVRAGPVQLRGRPGRG